MPDPKIQPNSPRGLAMLWVVLIAVLAVAILGPLVYFSKLSNKDDGRKSAAAEQVEPTALTGVQEFPGLSRNHVLARVTYPQTPPVGGDHAGVWMNCGAYTEVVPPEMAVHSLEHGAVWIAYRPDLPETDLTGLRQLAENNDYVLLSPVPDMSSAVVATAWGVQMPVSEAGDGRLPTFVETYANGPQTPEPGAPCSGGYGQR